MIQIQNERLVVLLDKQHAIKSASVFPIEWFSETDARQLPPRDLVPGELEQLAALFDAATIAKCDALADQVATLTKERHQALEQLEPLQQTIAALQAELAAIRNPPGPDLSTVDGAKQFISSQRYDNETGGFRVGDQFVSTERDEIGHWFPRYFNAYQWKLGDKATRAGNPSGLYPFKPKNRNPTVLNADQVLRVYDCLTWFINSCFAVEAAAYARLEAGAAIADVFDSIQWPQNVFDWLPPTE